MSFQDDSRENEMCDLLGLRKGVGRSGVDAFYDFVIDGERYAAPLELKSTSSTSVSTARDVGPSHIEKWRMRIWLFGFYDKKGTTLRRLVALRPFEMEPWIGRIEKYIASDFTIGERVYLKLTAEDLHIVCGDKPRYSLTDAQALYKKQWSKDMYREKMDIPNGYTPERMLEILKLRAQYLNNRGSTLNNPHIPKTFFDEIPENFVDVQRSSIDETNSRVRESIMEGVLANDALARASRGFASSNFSK